LKFIYHTPKFCMCLHLPWAEDAKEIYVDLDFRAEYSFGSKIMNGV